MLNKKLSVRELVLLALLVVCAAYYFIVQGPIATETTEAESEKANLEARYDEASSMVSQIGIMQTEINKVKSGEVAAKKLPTYNNSNNILSELNSLLASTEDYYIEFGDKGEDSSIVKRQITITFVTSTYNEAVNIIDRLNESENAYSLLDLSITESSNSNSGNQWTTVVQIQSNEVVMQDEEVDLSAEEDPTAANSDDASNSDDTSESNDAE